MDWGKRQIPLISPWLASVILQNFEFPHTFPSNPKQCREFSPAQGHRRQFIPLYSPTYSPGWPGVLPQGQADDTCIRQQRSEVEAVSLNVRLLSLVWLTLTSQQQFFRRRRGMLIAALTQIMKFHHIELQSTFNSTSFPGATPLSRWRPPSWKRSRPWERGCIQFSN